MNELGCAHQLRNRGKALLQPVLDRLDVVVGRLLDRLDALGVRDGEGATGICQGSARRRRERRNFGHSRFLGQRLQPCEFDLHAVAYQAVFAEVLREGRQPCDGTARRAG